MNAQQRWRNSSWLGLLPIVGAAVFMAWLSWRKWPDPVIDFGMQLYVPWKLSTGTVLYRDVVYLFGSLSQLYHGWLFKIFGASFDVIVASNFLLLAIFLLLLYRRFLVSSDQLTATIVGLSVVLLFAFPQYIDVSNYNYISPYTHEVLHGLMLSILIVALLSRWLERRTVCPLVASGICYGLLFHTKPDIHVAATGMVAAAFVIYFCITKSLVQLVKASSIFVIFTLAGAAVVFVYFLCVSDFETARRSIVWPWSPLFAAKVRNNSFYLTVLGLDRPLFNVGQAVLHFICFAFLIAVCSWRLRRSSQTSLERVSLMLGVGTVAVYFNWLECGRSLPLLVLFVAAMLWREFKTAPEQRQALLFPTLWVVLSFLLLSKMGLHSRISHYGVFLSMPAFIAAVYGLFWLLPRWLGKYQVPHSQLRGLLFLFLAIGMARLTFHSFLFYRDKTVAIGAGPDRIMAYDAKVSTVGETMAHAAAWIEHNVPKEATMAALPEGVFLNYITRRSNPTPHLNLLSWFIFMAGNPEFKGLALAPSFQQHPPDYIALVHRDSAEMGIDFFGRKENSGRDLMQWITAHYRPVYQHGAEPLVSAEFGIKILKKVDVQSAPP